MCGVFIWSQPFDDDPREDPDESDLSDPLDPSDPPAADPDATSDPPAYDPPWRARAPDAPDADRDPSAPAPAAAPNPARNPLYLLLRERTTGPDDVDRLRSLATECAADAFRRIVMGILGTIPADIYEVVVTTDRSGVARLMQSSLSTGYALRNAEFRMLLNESMAASPARSEDVADRPDIPDLFAAAEPDYMRGVPRRGRMDVADVDGKVMWWDTDREAKQEMSAREYVARLEAENELLKERLAATQLHDKNNNKLMTFMRTLSPDKIAALQGSLGVDAADAFKRVVTSVLGELSPEKVQQTYSTNRDYLAQLTFWCLLVGYCIRNIEKRLEMTKIFEETEAFAEPSVRDFEF